MYSEQYILSIEVEAKLVVDMATTTIYPAAISYLSDLAATSAGLAEYKIDLDTGLMQTIAAQSNAMMAAVGELSKALAQEGFATAEEHMTHCAGTVRTLMDQVRVHADVLETAVADELWPLPKYQEMLFIK